MTVYTATNGAIIADLTALRAIPSTDLPASGFVVLFVAAENAWYEYDSTLTSGDVTPTDSPATGRWLRIGRDRLRANRTYFVRTDGNDANTGLANTSGGAFLTIQKAIDVVATLDLNGFNITIKLGNGTYTNAVTLKEITGYSSAGCLIIEGDTATPSNVVLSVTNNNVFLAKNINSTWDIQGVRLQTTTGGSALRVENASVRYGSVVFGACAIAHIVVDSGASIECIANYSITASTIYHWYGGANSTILCANKTISITGTPNFSDAFAVATQCCVLNIPTNTYSGSATGKRYSAIRNGVIDSSVTLPGNVAGTTDGFGVYT